MSKLTTRFEKTFGDGPASEQGSIPGEVAHFARAAAAVLQGLTGKQITHCGEDLLELIECETPVSALTKISRREKPSRAEIRLIAGQLMRKRKSVTALDQVLDWLGDIYELDLTERTILAVFARWGKFDGWRELVRRSGQRCSNLTPAVAARLSGLPVSLVEQKLMPGTPLLAGRLINDDGDGEFSLSRLLRRIVRIDVQTREDFMRRLIPEPEVSTLLWEDFAHLGQMRDVAERVVAAGHPVSVLLFGEPGTGKTEFARALATRLGGGAHFAGLADFQGMEPDRQERLDHLVMLRALCRKQRERVLVVDEADDVLVLSERRGGSKQWINRLVEEPQVTTIWIVNDREMLDPAVLRRMTLAIGFQRPPPAVRKRIVKRAAEAAGVTLEEIAVCELAGLQTSAAVIASGCRAARLAEGGSDVARAAICSVMKAMGEPTAPERVSNPAYDPKLSRADADLDRLAKQLSQASSRSWSLLLSGPSGTGKSAFARHLAECLGLEIEERRCSDLLSPFVGQTERRIAEAFASAAERNAVLLIDEADSFLHRRGNAVRSWEVSQVNEMLLQMEHLRTPFIATTNLAGNLDPASQRRFTVRVNFQVMSPDQARDLFNAQFGLDWPKHLSVHYGQTPGDFAVVAQRAELLDERDPTVLIAWLGQEIEARGGQIKRRMGFN